MGDIARNIKNNAQRLITAMLDCEKPIVCAVNGTAAGMGAHMVFASDLILAADTAKFIEVFTRRGIIPDAGGAYLLPRIIGLPKAKELMFFADDLSAADAERLGLVNKVVPAEELAKEAERMGRAPGRRPDEGHRDHQVAPQPLARQRPQRRARRRGPGPGDHQPHRRRRRGCRRVRRTPRRPVQGLVAGQRSLTGPRSASRHAWARQLRSLTSFLASDASSAGFVPARLVVSAGSLRTL